MTRAQKRSYYRRAAKIAFERGEGGCHSLLVACRSKMAAGYVNHYDVLQREFERVFRDDGADAYWWGYPPRDATLAAGVEYTPAEHHTRKQEARVLALLFMLEVAP